MTTRRLTLQMALRKALNTHMGREDYASAVCAARLLDALGGMTV